MLSIIFEKQTRKQYKVQNSFCSPIKVKLHFPLKTETKKKFFLPKLKKELNNNTIETVNMLKFQFLINPYQLRVSN